VQNVPECFDSFLRTPHPPLASTKKCRRLRNAAGVFGERSGPRSRSNQAQHLDPGGLEAAEKKQSKFGIVRPLFAFQLRPNPTESDRSR